MEIINKRTLKNKVYKEGNKYICHASISPAHYKVGGLQSTDEWQDIVLTPENPKTLFILEYPDKDNPMLVRYKSREPQSDWVYIEPLDVPALFDRKKFIDKTGIRKWENVWEDVDLEIKLWPDRVGFFKILKSGKAKNNFRFLLYSKNEYLNTALPYKVITKTQTLTDQTAIDLLSKQETSEGIKNLFYRKATVRDMLAWDSNKKMIETKWDWIDNVRIESVTIPNDSKYPIYVDTDVEEEISSGANDGNWGSDESFTSVSETLYVQGGYLADPDYNFYLFFNDIEINGALTSAQLQLYVSNFENYTAFAAKAYANDTQTPTAPTNFATAEALSLTTAYKEFDSGANDIIDIATIMVAVIAGDGETTLLAAQSESAANSYEIKGVDSGDYDHVTVVVAPQANASLSAVFSSGVLTITLGTDALGDPDDTKNTFALIGAAINATGLFSTVLGEVSLNSAIETAAFVDYGATFALPIQPCLINVKTIMDELFADYDYTGTEDIQFVIKDNGSEESGLIFAAYEDNTYGEAGSYAPKLVYSYTAESSDSLPIYTKCIRLGKGLGL